MKKVKKDKGQFEKDTYYIMIIALLLLLVSCFGCMHLAYLNNPVKPTSKVKEYKPSYTRSSIDYLKGVELEDNEREIVYDGENRKTNRYPVINISSDEIDDLNKEIYYLQQEKIKEGYTVTYDYGVFDKYLIVNLVIEKDACNLEFANYIVDLQDYSVVTSETALRELGFEDSKVLAKVKTIVENEYERTADQEKELYKRASLGDIFSYRLSVLDNDLCLVVTIKNNDTCSNNLRINLENYTYSYIVY